MKELEPDGWPETSPGKSSSRRMVMPRAGKVLGIAALKNNLRNWSSTHFFFS